MTTTQEFTLNDFFKLVKDAVRHYPAHTDGCRYPHTFAVVQKQATLKDPLFGHADGREQDTLLLRKKKDDDRWPAVLLFVGSGSQSNSFGNCNTWMHEIEIGVIDQKDSGDCKNCTYCQKRTEEQLYQDTATMLTWIETYVGAAVYATYDGKSGWVSEIYAKNFLDYAPMNLPTRYLQKHLLNNRNARTVRWNDLMSLRLYGITKRLNIPTWENKDCRLELNTSIHAEDCC